MTRAWAHRLPRQATPSLSLKVSTEGTIMFSRRAVGGVLLYTKQKRLLSTATDAEAVLASLSARGFVGLHLSKELKEDVLVSVFYAAATASILIMARCRLSSDGTSTDCCGASSSTPSEAPCRPSQSSTSGLQRWGRRVTCTWV